MHSTPSPRHIQELRADLLIWYDRVRRDLPWRSAGDLYATWVSEIMLQQTTVAAVVPFFRRFLLRFPDVGTLAAATQDQVLACWSGLGYYSRARLLHRAAGMIVEREGGALPTTREGWAALPGVGEYTSGAIASIGLGERVPAIDANARRVITRWHVGDVKELPDWTAAAVASAAAALVDPEDPGTWNQAVMELGALICRAAVPRCPDCPVMAHCRAHAAGVTDEVPAPRRREPMLPVTLAALVLDWEGRLFLVPPGSGPAAAPVPGAVPVRAELRGLHRGLWSLPMTAWFPAGNDGGPDGGPDGCPDAIGSALLDPGLWSGFLQGSAWPAPPLIPGAVCGIQRHTITHHRLRVVVHRISLAAVAARRRPGPGPQSKKDLLDEGIPVYNSQDLTGRFFHFRNAAVPVSRLVTKCLQTAGWAWG